MTYTETQLEAIKIFGKKELSFGCIFKYGDCYTRYCHPGTSFHMVQKLNADTYAIGNEDFKKIEILGHIPHLEDLFRLAEESIEKDFSKFCYIGCTMSTLEIYGWRKPDGKLDEFGPANNTYTLLHEIAYKPSLPLLDQPNLSDIISLFR